MAGKPKITQEERRRRHLERKRVKYKTKHPDTSYSTRAEALSVHPIVYHCNICKRWHTSTKQVAGVE